MKIADGARPPSNASGASTAHLDADAERDRVGGDAVAAPLIAFECHRRAARPLRHHSTAMLPEPAPTSHSSSPGRGASAANVTARMHCLVICPSWTNASSGSDPTARSSGR